MFVYDKWIMPVHMSFYDLLLARARADAGASFSLSLPRARARVCVVRPRKLSVVIDVCEA